MGARDFDLDRAVAAIEKNATQPGLESSPGFQARPGLDNYLKKGIASISGKVGDTGISGTGGRANSQTLDYAVADFAGSRLALAAGNAALADRLLRQAQHWKAIVDANGMFEKGSFAEGSVNEYRWMVPHNLGAYAQILGGPAPALEQWKTKTTFGFHNQGQHHNAWAANWLGAPWETQRVTRQSFLNEFISVKGLERGQHHWFTLGEAPRADVGTAQSRTPGADDLGSMTAMAVWLGLGVFPMIPGEPGFTVGSPLVTKAVLNRGANGTLTIEVENADLQNAYVQSLTIDGAAHTSSWIPFTKLKKDSVLRFVMGAQPNKAWGNDPPPPSFDAEPWYKNPR